MERHEIDPMEIEANGHIPHHLQGQLKAERVERLMKIVRKEALDQLEPGQNFLPGISDYTPCNTLR